MNWLRNLVVLALALVLSNPAEAGGKGKKKAKPIKATVVEVKTDALVVKTIVGKKQTGTPVEKTFKVTDSTTFEKVQGKKAKGAPATPPTPAKFSDVQKDSTVSITPKGEDEAASVKILTIKKAKKKKSK